MVGITIESCAMWSVQAFPTCRRKFFWEIFVPKWPGSRESCEFAAKFHLALAGMLEEIVGNIYDEFDPQAEAEITRVDEDTWRISGQAALEDVADALAVELPLDEDYDTFGGYVFSNYGMVPEDGSEFELELEQLHVHVTEIKDHRILKMTVVRLPDEEDEDDDEDEDKDEDNE